MSKWVKELESVLQKKEIRPTNGKWYTRPEINNIIRSSQDNCRKFINWAVENKKVKKFAGATLTESKILSNNFFYKPIKKSWHQLHIEYAKSKERKPSGTGWKTFTQLCRELKLSETHGRRILSILANKNKIEVFKGGIADRSTRVTAIKFYRLRG